MTERALRLGALVAICVPLSLARGSDLESAARESDLVLAGQVASVREVPDSLGRKEWLEAEVLVAEVWKGPAGIGSVRVLTPGGALAAPGLALEGSARFVPGERVLLFLTRDGERYRPWRTVFGKYPIRGQGSEATLGGAAARLADPGDFHAGPSSLALEEVRETIRKTVASPSGKPAIDLAWRAALE